MTMTGGTGAAPSASYHWKHSSIHVGKYKIKNRFSRGKKTFFFHGHP
jgi:hypothetical protein